MLSRLVITFPSRSKSLLISLTICSGFRAPQNKVCHCLHFSLSICHEVMVPEIMIFVFWMCFKPTFSLSSFTFSFFLIFIFTLFYFTILYWFCHTLTWIHHECTWAPNPEHHSHLPHHIISLDHPRAPSPSILYSVSNIDWRFTSYMIVYMFQCHSPKWSHPLPLPQSPKVLSIHLCLFCCLTYRVIITSF